LQNQKYRELLRKHLSRAWDRLFAEFTGLHFHMAWEAAAPKGGQAHPLPSGCSVCCKLSGSPLLRQCRTCGPHHLRVTLVSSRGHSFTCHLGVRNYWLPLRVRSQTLGIAYLQALEHSPRHSPKGTSSTATAESHFTRRGAIVSSRLNFTRAARFLHEIVHHVQTASLSDLREADLNAAARSIVALEREQARLHEALRRYLPGPRATARASGPQSHAEQVVQALLQRIQLDFAKPITLQGLSGEFQMNTAYLSSLFSRAIGVPFKTYLTEVRIQKAKELLGDVARTAAAVASATGYSSEEMFRFAFKKATGLSPKAWRETMQVSARPVRRSRGPAG